MRSSVRWALGIAGTAVLLLVVYAAAGFWLGPRLLLHTLQDRAARLGLTLAIEEARTDPFSLTVTLAGLEVRNRSGERVAAAHEVFIDAAWASLWKGAWIVPRASVAAPYVEVVLAERGIQNWPVSASEPQNPTPAGGSTRPIRVSAISVTDGTLHLLDRSKSRPIDLTLRALAMEMQGFATRGGEAQYRLSAEAASGGRVASAGTVSAAPLAAHGTLSLAAVPLAAAWQVAAPSAAPLQGMAAANARYAFRNRELVLYDLVSEAAGVAYEGVRLDRVELRSPEVRLPARDEVEFTASAALHLGGVASLQGTIAAQPLKVHARLQAADLPLPLAQRLLPDSMALTIASGSVSGKGTVQASKEGARYEGSLEVRGLELHERDSGRLLLGWALARTGTLAFDSAARSLEADELELEAPRGRLGIEKDGRVNVADIFQRGATGGGPPMKAALKRLRIENGTLEFADRSLETPFETTLRDLSGTLTGFSTRQGDPALVALSGRVGEYGSVRIRGTLNLAQPKSLANVSARFQNLRLEELAPYVVKFAGYRVREGRLSANLRYRVRDGRLVGDNELVFTELRLGEKVEGAGVADLPLDLAVALLADEQGRIALDIPVRGNLSDPQFDFGGLFARALGNAIGKIVSAPFRALASVFGGGKSDELDEVRFEPGSATLSPPQEETVAKVAKALDARPRLSVTVRGAYDPERDAVALRRQLVRREIAKRAGYAAAGPLDFTDPRTVQAAERLYLERIANRDNLRQLRDRAPNYGRELVERLAYVLPENAVQAERLALERADSVREALVQHGVDPGRVELETAGERGVSARLALVASGEGSAAAGGKTAVE